jgi:DNA gyrase subunit A
LIDGQGNFGSVDNDPPAAMRYTETRLAGVSNQTLLSDISEEIVDFTDNFDNSLQEPVVLPAQLPILLLNGCSGIAVGMATNIPPHNLNEVVDALIMLIDQPQVADEKLWEVIQAPDFPTGGEILDLKGVHEAYQTGRGIITVRGVTKVEKMYFGKNQTREKTAIIITELPYQVNKASWIEKVADLVNQGRIEGIGDIRDESDRDGIRVVIELKRDVSSSKVIEQLYQLTPLENNFGIIILALVDNQPRQLSLRQLLDEFLQFREATLTRKYNQELTDARQRLHLVEGLLIALHNLDQVITILRQSPDGSTAKITLQSQLGISESQGDSILAMPLRRLTSLEQEKIQAEVLGLQNKITELERLLGDRHELLKFLKKELRSLKRQYGDVRRTRIVRVENNPTPTPVKTSRPEGMVKVTTTGCIYWQKPGETEPPGVVYRESIPPQQELIVVTDQGKAYPINLETIPHHRENSTQLLMRLLPKGVQKDGSKVIAQFFPPDNNAGQNLLLVTKQGRVKRLPISELEGLTNRGLQLIKLREGDSLAYVCVTDLDSEVAIATQGGRIVRYQLKDEKIPILGRNSQGIAALTLRPGEEIVGCTLVKPKEHIILVSELGYVKRLLVSNLRVSQPGNVGTQSLKFINPLDNLVGILREQPGIKVCFSVGREQKQLPLENIPILAKDSPGEQLVNLKQKEKIVHVYMT